MVIIFRALWVKRGSISRWMILWRFSCLYVAISVIIKDLYAQSQVLFVFHGPHQLHFHIILWKQLHISLGWGGILVKKRVINTFTEAGEWMITLPPFSLVVKERVALLRKLAVVRHGLQSREDLLEHWPLLSKHKAICSTRDSKESIHMLLIHMLSLCVLLTFGSVAQQLLISSAKLTGQPLGMVNLWNTNDEMLLCKLY